MKTISKALVGTVAAGAMALASATPAMARDRDGIDAGDIIAGALIIGGIAAVAGSIGNDRGYNGTYGGPYYGDNGRYDSRYGDRYGYNRAGNPRQAVEQCVYAAERNARRYSYGGRAKVTDIRSVNNRRDGYTVKGRIAVNSRSNNWRSGWGNDYRGYNDNYRGYDAGRFTCDVRYGRVVDLDYSGIRGL